MLILPAYAKVNLALEVVRRRTDGRHDIDSVVAPIDWHDVVGVRLGAAEPDFRVTGVAATGVPDTPDNLAVRAAQAMNDAAARPRGADQLQALWLDKRIPAGAGLGGGSADAAAVVRGGRDLYQRCGVMLDDERVTALAALLGSDVPALLAPRPVRVAGHGDVLTPLDLPVLHLVVVFLEPAMTGAAYHAVEPGEMSGGDRVNRLLDELRAGALPSDATLGSALERAALRVNPVLAAAVSRLRDSVPTLHWHMTGSGGAYFALVENAAAARDVAGHLQREDLLARACRTLCGVATGE